MIASTGGYITEVTRNTKICKVDLSRGWPAGMYEILSYGDSQCTVKHIDSGLIDIIYRAHLRVDLETVRYQKEWCKNRAAKIGTANRLR